MKRRLLPALCALMTILLPSCGSTGGGSYGDENDNGPEVRARDATIAAEPRGNWYIGRRYFTNKCRYWGYLRKPGELWGTARMVVIDESAARTPDRLPEAPLAGNAHGYDHNAEYRVWGSYTGRTAYDPNSDRELPVFAATRFELISANPGFLFSPRERYSPNYVPAREARQQSQHR
jgi:hypothetical protein